MRRGAFKMLGRTYKITSMDSNECWKGAIQGLKHRHQYFVGKKEIHLFHYIDNGILGTSGKAPTFVPVKSNFILFHRIVKASVVFIGIQKRRGNISKISVRVMTRELILCRLSCIKKSKFCCSRGGKF